jgi:hypothetical protein
MHTRPLHVTCRLVGGFGLEEFDLIRGEARVHAATLGERREERHSALDGSGCTGE